MCRSGISGGLCALRELSGAEWVARGDQPAGGIHDPASAIGGLTGVDEQAALSLSTEAESFVGQYFVDGEAVVQFDHHGLAGDLDRLGRQPALLDELLAGQDRSSLVTGSLIIGEPWIAWSV